MALTRHQYIQVQISDYLKNNLNTASALVNSFLDGNAQLRTLSAVGDSGDFNVGWHPDLWEESYLSVICPSWNPNEPGSPNGFFEAQVRITQVQSNPLWAQEQAGGWLQAMHDLFDNTSQTGWNLDSIDPDGIKRVAITRTSKEIRIATDSTISGLDALIEFAVFCDLDKLG